MNLRLACAPAVRIGAALAILAAPAAAGVLLRLDGPREPLGSRQEVTLEAVVTGAGDETGVLWSASEVIEGEVGRTFRGIWPWDPEVRFRPDGPGGRASFAAPGRPGSLRTFQIRAASMRDPKIFRCVRIEVRSDADAQAETKSQDGSTIPEGKAAAAAASSRRPGLAWETPFRLGSMGYDDEFQPAVFRFREGQPCLVGEYRLRDRGHFFPARMGPDNKPKLVQDPGVEPVYRPAGIRATLDCLADGGAVLVGRTPMRIWKIGPEGRPVVLAGTGQPPEDGAQAGAGVGGPAQEACLRVVGRLTACQDGSVAWFDGNANQIRRVSREGILEALAGGGDRELARMVEAIFAAVRDAGPDGNLDLPWRCREALVRVAGTDPGRPGHLRDLRLAAVAGGGKGLRAARNQEGKALAVLPDAVQHHVVSFLDDYPALVFRALVALHVLDRKLATLPGEKLAAFLASRPAGVPAEAEGESGGGAGDL